jgi:hypothetical protein
MTPDVFDRFRDDGSSTWRAHLPAAVSGLTGLVAFLIGYSVDYQPRPVVAGVMVVILGLPLWLGYRDHPYLAALGVAAFPATATVIGPWMATAPSSGYMNYVSLILMATAVTNPIATITYAVGISTGDGKLLRNRLQTFAVRLIAVLLYTIFVALGFYFAILYISTMQ